MAVIGESSAFAETSIGFVLCGTFIEYIRKVAGDYILELPPQDELSQARCLNKGLDEIRDYLRSRGLTDVQISTWNRGEEFQLDIAMYFYAVECGWGGKNIDEKNWPSRFDRREDLKNIPIYSNTGTLLLRANTVVAVAMDLVSINRNLNIIS